MTTKTTDSMMTVLLDIILIVSILTNKMLKLVEGIFIIFIRSKLIVSTTEYNTARQPFTTGAHMTYPTNNLAKRLYGFT